METIKKGESGLVVKEDNELDFWMNVWNKRIIEDVQKQSNLSVSDKEFSTYYNKQRIVVAESQLDGILWMAKKPKSYLDDKIVLEIGPGCCCALEVSGAKTKIAIEPLSERYRLNDLLLKNNDSVIYLTCGSEKIPLFSNYADIVIASNSLDHVEDIIESIKEINRILKPGGELFLNIEINHEPTECEPFSLSKDDVISLFSFFETVFIEETGNPTDREWVRAVFKKMI